MFKVKAEQIARRLSSYKTDTIVPFDEDLGAEIIECRVIKRNELFETYVVRLTIDVVTYERSV